MSWIKDELAHLEKLASKWKDKLIPVISKIQDDFQPLFKQIQSELSQDAYDLVKQELNVAISAAMSAGGISSVGGAIAATVPGLITKLELDGNAAAKNAIYGIASLIQAKVSVTPTV